MTLDELLTEMRRQHAEMTRDAERLGSHEAWNAEQCMGDAIRLVEAAKRWVP
jgi:hypothetical protein